MGCFDLYYSEWKKGEDFNFGDIQNTPIVSNIPPNSLKNNNGCC